MRSLHLNKIFLASIKLFVIKFLNIESINSIADIYLRDLFQGITANRKINNVRNRETLAM